MDREKAKEDFLQRINHYKKWYEPLDEQFDQELSYIQVFNAGKSFFVHNIIGKQAYLISLWSSASSHYFFLVFRTRSKPSGLFPDEYSSSSSIDLFESGKAIIKAF